ncbi:g11769 [Coccomyxa elongata]
MCNDRGFQYGGRTRGVGASAEARRMRFSSSSRCARERLRLAASAELMWPQRFMSALSLDGSVTARLRDKRKKTHLEVSQCSRSFFSASIRASASFLRVSARSASAAADLAASYACTAQGMQE